MYIDKMEINKLAKRFVHTANADIFARLLEKLKPLVMSQLHKKYQSMYHHWDDMCEMALQEFSRNRRTLGKSKTKVYAEYYRQRARTNLLRACEKIKKTQEDFALQSKTTFDNIYVREPGFVDDEMPDEVDKRKTNRGKWETPEETEKRIEDTRLDDEEGKKVGESTLKKKLAGQKAKLGQYFAKRTIRREERNPILDICNECQLQCKRHTVKGDLIFQCFKFLPFDESKKGLIGAKTQQGRGLPATKKPRTHIIPSQHSTRVPWKRDKQEEEDARWLDKLLAKIEEEKGNK